MLWLSQLELLYAVISREMQIPVRVDPTQEPSLKILAAAPTYKAAPPVQLPQFTTIADLARILLCVQGTLQQQVAGSLVARCENAKNPVRGMHFNLLKRLTKLEAHSPGSDYGRG